MLALAGLSERVQAMSEGCFASPDLAILASSPFVTTPPRILGLFAMTLILTIHDRHGRKSSDVGSLRIASNPIEFQSRGNSHQRCSRGENVGNPGGLGFRV